MSALRALSVYLLLLGIGWGLHLGRECLWKSREERQTTPAATEPSPPELGELEPSPGHELVVLTLDAASSPLFAAAAPGSRLRLCAAAPAAEGARPVLAGRCGPAPLTVLAVGAAAAPEPPEAAPAAADEAGDAEPEVEDGERAWIALELPADAVDAMSPFLTAPRPVPLLVEAEPKPVPEP